jgi:hypothetical protein
MESSGVPWDYNPSPKFHSLAKIRDSLNKDTVFIHLQTEWKPWLGGYRPQISVLSALCPQLNLLNPPKKFLANTLPSSKE